MKFFGILFSCTVALAAETIVIRNVDVYPVTGPEMKGVSVVLQDGKIGEIGARIAPIKGARVTIESTVQGSNTAAPAVINALTNEQGDFELVGIAPGVRSVVIGAYQHNMRAIGGLRFEEGTTVGPVTYDLNRTRPGEEPHAQRRTADSSAP